MDKFVPPHALECEKEPFKVSSEWTQAIKDRCAGRCGDVGDPPCYRLLELTSDAPKDIKPCAECSSAQPEAVTNAGDVCKQVCDDNLLRFYISELKKTHTLVDNLVMTLKDCHPHISNDSIRARVGNMIVYADKFKKGEE